jgi:peptidoglycan-associated lipoprotein
MNMRLLPAISLTLALLSLTGCPHKFTNGECENTTDCQGQQGFETTTCIEKHCVECGGDTDCKTGFQCKNNHCAPKPECTPVDNKCGTGKTCKEGKCQVGCDSDANCATGQKCSDHQCLAAPHECESSAQCPAGQKCSSFKCVSDDVVGECKLQTVSFGYNDSTLTSDAQGVLKSNADCLVKKKSQVRIEGHCDERGTEEYNLQLGNKRAESVKKYLKSLGVDEGKMSTISFGKERPVDQGHDESAWSKNRRAELVAP